MYAVVDLETTGATPGSNRILEVAVVIHDGKKIVDEFSSLINPEARIPYFITNITGITNEMVEDAPKFYEVARTVVELTEGKVFVAHNCRFDYSFMKKEFAELGFKYQRKTLCTVRLSRKLIPGEPSYSLGTLCKSVGIDLHNHHRALDDAKATAELLGKLLDIDNKDVQGTIVDHEIQTRLLPPKLEKKIVDELPESTGIYYFHDDQGRVLYIGKSKNIKQRIVSHLQVEHKSKKSLQFKQAIADISYEITGSEILALLRESEEIKRLRPEHNRALKRQQFNYGLFHYKDDSGYMRFYVGQLQPIDVPITLVNSRLAGKKLLERLVEKYELCSSMVSLYKSGAELAACENCCGACKGDEQKNTYNRRAQKILKKYKFQSENFFIFENGRHHSEQAVILIENNHLTAYGYIDESVELHSPEDLKQLLKPCDETHDARQVLLRFLPKLKQQQIRAF